MGLWSAELSGPREKIAMDPRERRRGQRIRIKIGIEIAIGSIGTREHFSYRTVDLSESGALVQGPGGKIFADSAILDVKIDLGPGSKPIEALAKQARIGNDGCVGIRFIQIEDQDYRRLQTYLTDLAAKHPELKC